MRERVQQAPQSARTSCRSTAQQLNAGFVADLEMSNQQLSKALHGSTSAVDGSHDATRFFATVASVGIRRRASR